MNNYKEVWQHAYDAAINDGWNESQAAVLADTALSNDMSYCADYLRDVEKDKGLFQ